MCPVSFLPVCRDADKFLITLDFSRGKSQPYVLLICFRRETQSLSCLVPDVDLVLELNVVGLY